MNPYIHTYIYTSARDRIPSPSPPTMRSSNRLLPLFLHILLWFQTAVEAVKGVPDLVEYRKPISPKVGVELDYQLAKAGADTMIAGKPVSKGKMQQRLIFMSHYDVPGTIPDVELVKIAMDGYMDMLASAKQYSIHKDDLPSVMTVFHWGKEIIVASSQKGGQAITYTRDNDVSTLVNECIKPADKSNDAKCGEMSAAQLFQKLHPNTPISSAEIVTVTVISDKRNNAFSTTEADLKVWPPCSKETVSFVTVQLLVMGLVLMRMNRVAVATRSLDPARLSPERTSLRFGLVARARTSSTPRPDGLRLLCRFCPLLRPRSKGVLSR